MNSHLLAAGEEGQLYAAYASNENLSAQSTDLWDVSLTARQRQAENLLYRQPPRTGNVHASRR